MSHKWRIEKMRDEIRWLAWIGIPTVCAIGLGLALLGDLTGGERAAAGTAEPCALPHCSNNASLERIPHVFVDSSPDGWRIGSEPAQVTTINGWAFRGVLKDICEDEFPVRKEPPCLKNALGIGPI